MGRPYAQSSTHVGSGAAPLGRVNRAGWLKSVGLPWDRLALGTGTPGESLHYCCRAGTVPSFSRPFPDFQWVPV